MDRSVLESDPHRVLEGMAIAAYAVGASQGFIYVRAEYPLADQAPASARSSRPSSMGLLGSEHLRNRRSTSTSTSALGAGAFVCGEETALMASVEGKRGTPRPRPPFPAETGLWGCPTLINNVETFANIAADHPQRAPSGSPASAPSKSKGTKVFALAGKITNTGLIEVPMGIAAARDHRRHRRRRPRRQAFKAVQTGGPSGGCIPARGLDMPVDYESLAKLGSIMGSGGMIVMDETTSMVDVARVLHGVLHGRVVRQVRPLPGRHGADARPARQDPRRARRPRATSRRSRSSATWSRAPASAASARPRPTRC